MVLTRNRSKAVAINPELSMELPVPTRARRTSRPSKASLAAVVVKDMHIDTDTAENSSVTPESESNAEDDPQEEEEEAESNDSHSHTPQLQEDESESESEDSDDNKEEEKEEALSPSSSEDEDEEEEDLSHLLVKAQASLKRKAMFEQSEKSEDEPRFNFPKLQTKLDSDNVYLQQEGNRVKVNLGTVVVVDKNSASKVPGGIIAARKAKSGGPLETCQVNMNAEKVHVSKKQKQEEREKTTGKGWFDLPQQVMTPELKRDLQILKLRNVLDPKRFYKREDKSKAKFPKYFQVGTIVQGNTEFYSSRLTKKERATTITGEVMKDEVGRDYYKRKFDEIQVAKQSGGKRFNKKGKGKQSKSWRAGK